MFMIKEYVPLLISMGAVIASYFQYKTGRFLSDNGSIDKFHIFKILANLTVAVLGLLFFMKFL